MGDMGEVFNAMRKAAQDKRAANREQSAKMLQDAGIPFDSHNHGAHLIVDGRYDFWPGTGLWIERSTKKDGRGVHSLMKHVKQTTEAAP